MAVHLCACPALHGVDGASCLAGCTCLYALLPLLQVAADNAAAVRLYTKCGYVPVKRTDRGACNCLGSRVLQFFLGHSVWIKMRKPLPAPAHLAAAQPAQQSMPAAVASGTAADSQFEDVALEAAQAPAAEPAAARMGCFGRRQPQPAATAARAAAAAGDSETGMTAPPAPGIHAGSLLRKLPNGAGVLGAQPASQGPTPRIGAVPASGIDAPASTATQPPPYHQISSLKEGGYTQLELSAAPASSDGGASHPQPAKRFAAPPASVSAASVDSDGEASGEPALSILGDVIGARLINRMWAARQFVCLACRPAHTPCPA